MNTIEQLRRDEGVRKFPYTDTDGNITIGVGRNLTRDGISDVEINFLLHNNVESVTNELQTRLPYFNAVDPIRQAVLVNLCFNIGFTSLEGFVKMLHAVAQGEWDIAAKEMLNSLWAKQTGDRATRLAQQMRTGKWV